VVFAIVASERPFALKWLAACRRGRHFARDGGPLGGVGEIQLCRAARACELERIIDAFAPSVPRSRQSLQAWLTCHDIPGESEFAMGIRTILVWHG
jgi:hypothetical protein